jgi:membrane protease YdiL (CAAX protease family)
LSAAPLNRRIAAFIVLFVLYQAAEGVGARLLHSASVQAVIMIGSLLAAWPIGRWLGYRGYDAYALDLSRHSLRLVFVGLLLAGLARLAALFWGLASGVYALGAPPSPPQGLALLILMSGAFVSTFVPSIAEDIVTRGFWLKAAAVRWSGPAFVLTASAIYVLNHIFRLAEGPVEWIRLFCFGLAYACAAWRWRSLWAAVGLHWGWNLSNALLDGFTSVNVMDAAGAPWLSVGAHLVLTATMLLWPRPPERATPHS